MVGLNWVHTCESVTMLNRQYLKSKREWDNLICDLLNSRSCPRINPELGDCGRIILCRCPEIFFKRSRSGLGYMSRPV
jgi:hypothetical protein